MFMKNTWSPSLHGTRTTNEFIIFDLTSFFRSHRFSKSSTHSFRPLTSLKKNNSMFAATPNRRISIYSKWLFMFKNSIYFNKIILQKIVFYRHHAIDSNFWLKRRLLPVRISSPLAPKNMAPGKRYYYWNNFALF